MLRGAQGRGGEGRGGRRGLPPGEGLAAQWLMSESARPWAQELV